MLNFSSFEFRFYVANMTNDGRNLKLKDLNDNCLIKIFSYLSLNDLVRIVDFDERFSAPAKYVFGQRFGKNPFKMDRFWYKKSKWVRARTLSMLNHFGDKITEIDVFYEDLTDPNEELGNLIIEKCHKSLVKINFRGTNQSRITKLIEPFENVRAVSFEHGESCDLISEFNKWFPKAKSLSLLQMKLTNDDKNRLQHNFPALEHFSFIESDQHHIDVNRFCELNPQIKSLSISDISLREVDWQNLFNVFATNLPNLQKFELIVRNHMLLKWMPSIVIENTDNGKIVNISNASNITNLINLVIKWPDLKKLIFPYKDYGFEAEKILNAVLKCESLEKLCIGYRHPTIYNAFSEDWITVKSLLDNAVAANGNKWKTNVVFVNCFLRRFDYWIHFEKVSQEDSNFNVINNIDWQY